MAYINDKDCINNGLMSQHIQTQNYLDLDKDILNDKFQIGNSILYILKTIGYKLKPSLNNIKCKNSIIPIKSNNFEVKIKPDTDNSNKNLILLQQIIPKVLYTLENNIDLGNIIIKFNIIPLIINGDKFLAESTLI